MNYRHPAIPKPPPHSEYEYARAADVDKRLQPDPELAAGEGRAGPLTVAAYIVAMVFFICLVIYGLNNSRDETAETASTPAAQDQGAPPAQQQAPPRQTPQPAQQQAKPANGGQPGTQQSGQPPAQQVPAPQQQAPAPKQ